MELIDLILDKCIQDGAEMAEVYRLSEKRLSLSVRDGQLETVQKSTPGGLAVRFFTGGKTAFAHTTEISEEAADDLAKKLAALAAKVEKDQFAVLPGAGNYVNDLDLFDDSRIGQPMESKIDYLMKLEKRAMDYDPLIQKSNGVFYDESLSTITLANTRGVSVSYDTTRYSTGISVVASKDGVMYPGEGSVAARHFDDLPDQGAIVERFASRAVRLVGGTPVEGGDYEIIFTPTAANSILWGLRFALDGDSAYKGSSFLAGKIGEKIAVEGLTLYDDAIMKRGLASRPADDEGVPSQKMTLIDKGSLNAFLYDTRTAVKAQAIPTGSAGRRDYSSYPGISTSNFYIAAGNDKADDVIASCKKGIIVEETQGWGLHSVTGQYSAGISGVLVENGRRIRPVGNVTIAAGADELLNGIGAICDDITFYDDFSSPTIMVKRMKVGA
jgi:PmbA protein